MVNEFHLMKHFLNDKRKVAYNVQIMENKVIQLSPSQISMLNLSDDDINNHRVISQEELDKSDLERLKSL